MIAHHAFAVLTWSRTVVVAVTIIGRRRGEVPTGPIRFWRPLASV